MGDLYIEIDSVDACVNKGLLPVAASVLNKPCVLTLSHRRVIIKDNK